MPGAKTENDPSHPPQLPRREFKADHEQQKDYAELSDATDTVDIRDDDIGEQWHIHDNAIETVRPNQETGK